MAYKWAQQARVFGPGKPFQHSVMLRKNCSVVNTALALVTYRLGKHSSHGAH